MDDDEVTSSSLEPKERDMSKRPGHYKTMHADLCVIHDCDLDKLKEMGSEFIHYPVLYLFGNRKREVIETFPADFKSNLMTDAYAVYKYFNNLQESTHLCCWAYVRRIFVSALRNYKDIKADEYIN